MDPEETITIKKKEYVFLLQDSAILQALLVFGVDNWEKYDEAIDYVAKDLNKI